MPPESLTIAVSSGFGIGIIAGIVSGVCYILVHGFSISRPRQLLNQWHCSICGEQFRSIEGILDSDKVVTCSKCDGKVCRKKCSIQEKENWICQTCQHPESWFKGILKVLHPSSIVGRSKRNMDPNRIDEIDEDLEAAKKKEKEQVRDFIERLVDAMLGGGIDNASISRIYNDEQYDIIISRYHSELSNTLTDLGSALHMSIANLPIIGQSPCSAHAGLKLLIQRIIQEAIGLPSMKKVPEHSGSPTEDINRTYEDLLATAIINKVIENYQDELPTSSANSVSSQRSNLSLPINKQYFFGEETLESKWKNNSTAGDVDTASVSSLEEWVRSDSSTGSTKYVDHMSLTIQQRIEEASSSDDERLLEDRSPEWQENWKLQKRQFAGSASPVPVPMLVPNPTIQAKVLIGDREADDTTDLSDAGSDYGDIERSHGIESILVDSKTVIGGKNLVTNVSVENQILSDPSTDASDMEEEREAILDQFRSYQDDCLEQEIPETVNKEVIKQAETLEDTSLDSHIEQDTEYTEKYATLDRTILKCSTPIISNMEDTSNTQHYASLEDTITETKVTNEHQTANQTEVEHSGTEDDELREKFKGTYSEREKQKWQNAVEMKNNPYTEENINRRLSQTSNSSIKALFGRDYYIKEAAKSTGARKYKNDDEDVQKPSNESNATNGLLFKAVPAVVDTESLHADIESPMQIVSPIPSSFLEMSSDSDLSIERTYNLTSGKVYEKVGNIHKEIIKRSSSPEGITFRSTNTELDKTFTMVDENHNSTTQDRKRSFLRSLTNTDESEEIDLPISPNDDVFCANPINQSCDDNHVPLIATPKDKIEDNLVEKINITSTDYVDHNKTFTVQEFSLDFSTGDEGITSPESSLNVNSDAEIVQLKDKHLVKDRLGLFSSYPNLASPHLKKSNSMRENSLKEQQKQKAEESDVQSSAILDTSVTDLRKKFHTVDSKEGISQKHVHSLTARSISQVIRKELKEIQNDKHEETINNGAIAEEISSEEIKSMEEVKPAMEIHLPEEIKGFPNAKSRINFFENLNR